MRLEDEKFGEMSPYGVRLPRALKEKIKTSAKEKRRSMNAEIVERLEWSFEDRRGIDSFDGLSDEQIKVINLMIDHLKK